MLRGLTRKCVEKFARNELKAINQSIVLACCRHAHGEAPGVYGGAVLHLPFLAMNLSLAREDSKTVRGHISAAWPGLAWLPDYRQPHAAKRCSTPAPVLCHQVLPFILAYDNEALALLHGAAWTLGRDAATPLLCSVIPSL